jgi:hypothetical protein
MNWEGEKMQFLCLSQGRRQDSDHTGCGGSYWAILVDLVGKFSWQFKLFITTAELEQVIKLI